MGGLTKEYVLKRVGMFLLTVWLGATIIFIVPRLMPGDPVTATIGRMIAQGGSVENADQMIEAWRERFGLDAPVHIQYIRYLGNLATFNTGFSLAFFPAEVDTLVARAAPWTIGLLFLSTILSFILGNHHRRLDSLAANARLDTKDFTYFHHLYGYSALYVGYFADFSLCFSAGMAAFCRRLRSYRYTWLEPPFYWQRT